MKYKHIQMPYIKLEHCQELFKKGKTCDKPASFKVLTINMVLCNKHFQELVNLEVIDEARG